MALFMVRPLIGDGGIATGTFSMVLLILLLFALYAIQVDELVGERETLLAQRHRDHEETAQRNAHSKALALRSCDPSAND